MIQHPPNPVVHLELHTGNLARACSFYSRVCGWQIEQVEVEGRTYQALAWGSLARGRNRRVRDEPGSLDPLSEGLADR